MKTKIDVKQIKQWKQIDDESYLQALKVILQNFFQIWDSEVRVNLSSETENNFRKSCVLAIGQKDAKTTVFIRPVTKYSYQLLFVVDSHYCQLTQSWVQPDIMQIYTDIVPDLNMPHFTITELYKSASITNLSKELKEIKAR